LPRSPRPATSSGLRLGCGFGRSCWPVKTINDVHVGTGKQVTIDVRRGADAGAAHLVADIN
jgi:hypothetical protein